MAKTKFDNSKSVLEAVFKKTSIGGNHSMIKTSSMNKNQKRSYKRYKGQGR